MLYTSRFSNPELKSGRYAVVRISIGSPKWPLGYEVSSALSELMPYGAFGIEDKETYRKKYIERLEKYGVDLIQNKLAQMEAKGKPVVLACYEDLRDPAQWCHRTMFAEWYMEKTGEVVEELTDPSVPRINQVPKQTAAKPIVQKPSEGYSEKTLELIRKREAELNQMSMFDMI